MTTRKVLYLATVTDGSADIDIERPATIEDIREVLRAEGLTVTTAYEPSGGMAMGQLAASSTDYTFGSQKIDFGGAALKFGASASPSGVILGSDLAKHEREYLERNYPAAAKAISESKEANGSNGHGHGEAAVAELPDLEVYGVTAKAFHPASNTLKVNRPVDDSLIQTGTSPTARATDFAQMRALAATSTPEKYSFNVEIGDVLKMMDERHELDKARARVVAAIAMVGPGVTADEINEVLDGSIGFASNARDSFYETKRAILRVAIREGLL